MEAQESTQERADATKDTAQTAAVKATAEAQEELQAFAQSILDDMEHLYSKNLSHAANLVLFKIVLQSCASLGWRKVKLVQYIKDTYPRIKRSTDARKVVYAEKMRNAQQNLEPKTGE